MMVSVPRRANPRIVPSSTTGAELYRGRTIAFGTKHGKATLVAGSFDALLRARVTAPANIDTDEWGTFSGEVERTLAPVAAARTKRAPPCKACKSHSA